MNEKESPVTTPTDDGIQISKEDFAKLSFRQKFTVTEYGYLLSLEDAEFVGKMLGSIGKEKDVLSFCQAKGKKVFGFERPTTTVKYSPKSDLAIGFFGWAIFHNIYFILGVFTPMISSSSGIGLYTFLGLPFLIGLLVLIRTKKVWVGIGCAIAVLISIAIWFSIGFSYDDSVILFPFPAGMIALMQ